LQIATLLAQGKPIVVIDTENGTSSIYAKGDDGVGFDFDTIVLDGDYSMDTLVACFQQAEAHVGAGESSLLTAPRSFGQVQMVH
jgi:hypothetical protein